MFKQNLLSAAIKKVLLLSIPALVLTACSGDDGSNGETGPQGPAGANGTDGTNGADGGNGSDGENGRDGSTMALGLTRLATVPSGAEVTGIFLTEEGDLFFNVQHPDTSNTTVDSEGKTLNKGTVGVLKGVNINKLPKNVISSPVPSTVEEKESVMSAYGVYQVLAQTGDTFGGTLPHGLATILATDKATEIVSTDMPDFNGFVPTGTGEGYLFTNWEYFPGGMSRIKIEKTDAADGEWAVDGTDVMMVDFGTYGTIANCFGSISPWGTPLTSEEWGNNGDATHTWNDPSETNDSRDNLARYIDPTASSAADAGTFPNTYRYHYIVEITDPTTATPTPVKHYTLGRYEHENSIVMPDQKTVYLSQDNTDGVFYKFVADTAGDLSAGTLYAAKLTQDPGSNEPAVTGFDITWIELASSNNTDIEAWIADYDGIDLTDYVDGKSNYLTDADAIAWAAGDATYPVFDTAYAAAEAEGYEGANTFGGSVTAGAAMDDRIAFLESRKAARAKGATAEWRKFEGIYANMKRAEEAVDGADLVAGEDVNEAYVYFAISDIDKGMIDEEGDMQLSTRVKDCGGVYRMALEADYDVSRIEPVLMGATYRSSLSGADRCDVNALSQPDNVIVMDDGRIIIGEDGGQANNTLWMYDPKVND